MEKTSLTSFGSRHDISKAKYDTQKQESINMSWTSDKEKLKTCETSFTSSTHLHIPDSTHIMIGDTDSLTAGRELSLSAIFVKLIWNRSP